MKAAADIVVVGSGAAGIAAAVSAARAGRTTRLLDQRPAAGGTGGFSGLTTLCGLFDDAGNVLNDGFVREFTQALGQTAPDTVEPGLVVSRFSPGVTLVTFDRSDQFDTSSADLSAK